MVDISIVGNPLHRRLQGGQETRQMQYGRNKRETCVLLVAALIESCT